MKSILLSCLLIAFIAGCSGTRPIVMSDKDLSKKETPDLSKLRYGYTLKKTKNSIGESGKLIFRFLHNNNEYKVYVVELREFNNAYCLLFNSGRLENVFESEKGIKKWRKVFGKDEGSFPNGYQVLEMLSELQSIKIDLVSYDFSTKGNIEYKNNYEYVYNYEYSSKGKEPGVEWQVMELSTYYGMLWPSLFKVTGAAFLYALAEGGYKKATNYISPWELENLKLSYDQYLTVLDKSSNLPLKTPMHKVRDLLGMETEFILNENLYPYVEEILIYRPLFGVALGFNNNKKLIWAAYDYDPELSFKQEINNRKKVSEGSGIPSFSCYLIT